MNVITGLRASRQLHNSYNPTTCYNDQAPARAKHHQFYPKEEDGERGEQGGLCPADEITMDSAQWKSCQDYT